MEPLADGAIVSNCGHAVTFAYYWLMLTAAKFTANC
jgi:hypothetical protein